MDDLFNGVGEDPPTGRSKCFFGGDRTVQYHQNGIYNGKNKMSLKGHPLKCSKLIISKCTLLNLFLLKTKI